jgi:cation diffusion facilitator family transporter
VEIMMQEKIMRRSFFGNIFLVIIKVISGFIFNSVSLIADGVHSTSDLMSDVFVILGIRHAAKPADEDHPFGHGKFEYILSFSLGISIIFIAYNLLKEVVVGFNDVPTIPKIWSLLIVVIVVFVKLFLSKYLIDQGKKIDSEIVIASGKESMTDVYSSGVVFVGIISVLLGNYFKVDWLLKGDKVASIIIALFIVRIGIVIMWDAVVSLQGKAVKKEISDVYRNIIKEVDGVIDVDHLDMIAYGPYYQALVDIQVDAQITVKQGHEIAKRVSNRLYEDDKITHAIVHVNPEGEQ